MADDSSNPNGLPDETESQRSRSESSDDSSSPMSTMSSSPSDSEGEDNQAGGAVEIRFSMDRDLFVKKYTVLSPEFLDDKGRQNWGTGGKVILPLTALHQLSVSNSSLPNLLIFKVVVPEKGGKAIHCGVLDFENVASICCMPKWMMEELGVKDFEKIQIERVDLPTGKYAKFQPQSKDFMEISDPKAILESCLRRFACLTRGDEIPIHYNNRIYKLRVLEVRPGEAINITECDLHVDFDDTFSPKDEVDESSSGACTSRTLFPGQGRRLNGKAVTASIESNQTMAKGTPDADWKLGTLTFPRKRPNAKVDDSSNNAGVRPYNPFGKTGRALNS